MHPAESVNLFDLNIRELKMHDASSTTRPPPITMILSNYIFSGGKLSHLKHVFLFCSRGLEMYHMRNIALQQVQSKTKVLDVQDISCLIIISTTGVYFKTRRRLKL